MSPIENIFNGDFSKGNTGFFTDYKYSANDLYPEGNYTITSNPYLVYIDLAPCHDHTTGTDSLMMVLNGSADPNRFMVCWGDSVKNVLPNNDYVFSFWATTCKDDTTKTTDPAILEVLINGQKLPGELYLTDSLCRWDYIEYKWNSGANRTAVITIYDLNKITVGNDFALDDISLRAVCSVQANAGPDVNICDGETTQIGKIPSKGVPPFTYFWQPQTGLSDPFAVSPTVNINSTTTFYETVTDSIGCVSYDTVTVNVISYPNSFISTDKPTAICPCDSVKLTAPTGDKFLWSTGDTSQSIYIRLPGRYSVNVSNQNRCSLNLDTQIVVLNYQTIVQLDTVFGHVGENITIPLHVISPVDESCILGQFDAEISYNKSLLMPAGDTPLGTINGDQQVINITGTAQGKLLKNFEFIATLGNAECTDIKLAFFHWACDIVQVDTISGHFCLKNLCDRPTLRLFDDTSVLYLQQVRPNPASDNIKIDFGLIEEGESSLEIYNFYGQRISKLYNNILKPGQYSLEFNVYNFENGSYIIRLITPNNQLYKTFQIVR